MEEECAAPPSSASPCAPAAAAAAPRPNGAPPTRSARPASPVIRPRSAGVRRAKETTTRDEEMERARGDAARRNRTKAAAEPFGRSRSRPVRSVPPHPCSVATLRHRSQMEALLWRFGARGGGRRSEPRASPKPNRSHRRTFRPSPKSPRRALTVSRSLGCWQGCNGRERRARQRRRGRRGGRPVSARPEPNQNRTEATAGPFGRAPSRPVGPCP